MTSKLIVLIGRLIPKFCAYSRKEGKSISNPMGVCCLSSLTEVIFDSINLRPAGILGKFNSITVEKAKAKANRRVKYPCLFDLHQYSIASMQGYMPR